MANPKTRAQGQGSPCKTDIEVGRALSKFGRQTQQASNIMIRLNEESGGKKDVSLYQLKVKLKWSKPAIWRRVVVRSDMRLDRLHTVIQVAMGWTNSHLHQFVLGQTFYGQTDPEFGAGMEVLNEKRYRLRDLADGAKKKFIYEYDFGDSWEHELVVEKVLAADPNFKHPVCTGGENACPPEDCGGIHGDYRMQIGRE